MQANAAAWRGIRLIRISISPLADVPKLRQAAATTHKAYFDNLKKWADKFVGFDPASAGFLAHEH